MSENERTALRRAAKALQEALQEPVGLISEDELICMARSVSGLLDALQRAEGRIEKLRDSLVKIGTEPLISGLSSLAKKALAVDNEAAAARGNFGDRICLNPAAPN